MCQYIFKDINLKNTLFILLGSAIFSFVVVNINMKYILCDDRFSGITFLLYYILFKYIIFIILGSAFFSFVIYHFNMQNNLGEGVFTGITLLLYFIWEINPAISNILLNLPVFLIGLKYLGKNTFIYTIIGTISVSIFLEIFLIYSLSITLHFDFILAALFSLSVFIY